MGRLFGYVSGLLSAGMLLMTTAGRAQQLPASASPTQGQALERLRPVERFAGKALIRTKGGGTRELHVLIRNWGLHGKQRVEKFPEEGFMVVQLHSGNLTTVINGQEQKRQGGDFWTVPAGTSMAVEVTSEAALLQAFVVKNQ